MLKVNEDELTRMDERYGGIGDRSDVLMKPIVGLRVVEAVDVASVQVVHVVG